MTDRQWTAPSRTWLRTVLGFAAIAAFTITAPVVSAAPTPDVGWTPVQKLDHHFTASVRSSIVTRAGTSVLVWSRGPYDLAPVRTSVRHAGDDMWSAPEYLSGTYDRDSVKALTAGEDDVVLFAARNEVVEPPSLDLEVARLEGTTWLPLEGLHIKAAPEDVTYAVNDSGAVAVVWVHDDSVLTGAISLDGQSWKRIPDLALDAGRRQSLSGLQLRNDGAVVVLTTGRTFVESWHPVYQASTWAEQSWDVASFTSSGREASDPAMDSLPDGSLVIAWVDPRPLPALVAVVRDARKTKFAGPRVLTHDYPCQISDTLECASVHVVDDGHAVAFWSAPDGSTTTRASVHDPATGTWSTPKSVVGKKFGSNVDVHPDGTTVLGPTDSADATAYVCQLVSDCIPRPPPDFFPRAPRGWSSVLRAGPHGSVAAYAGQNRCPRLCSYGKLRAAYLGPSER